jgi:hypothetical protein
MPVDGVRTGGMAGNGELRHGGRSFEERSRAGRSERSRPATQRCSFSSDCPSLGCVRNHEASRPRAGRVVDGPAHHSPVSRTRTSNAQSAGSVACGQPCSRLARGTSTATVRMDGGGATGRGVHRKRRASAVATCLLKSVLTGSGERVDERTVAERPYMADSWKNGWEGFDHPFDSVSGQRNFCELCSFSGLCFVVEEAGAAEPGVPSGKRRRNPSSGSAP